MAAANTFRNVAAHVILADAGFRYRLRNPGLISDSAHDQELAIRGSGMKKQKQEVGDGGLGEEGLQREREEDVCLKGYQTRTT